MILLIAWGLLLCGLVVTYALLRALQGIQEPLQTDCRELPQNAPTGLVEAHARICTDDGGEYIEGTAVRL